ncbi:uncharacterized protein K441DRAFT_633538, partial [Cenococcum geophilum 1.58]|uniref:uncharacterized protein n=1 Tax=Cenococcum geophilum 1.58 TaxID=794803 RepID=UPI00358FD450
MDSGYRLSAFYHKMQLHEVLFLLLRLLFSILIDEAGLGHIWSSGRFFFVSKVRKCLPSCRRSASRENMSFVADK